jgi:hypothetical protein
MPLTKQFSSLSHLRGYNSARPKANAAQRIIYGE